MGDLLGGFIKGLSTLMPEDDPDTKILKAQTELNDLKRQETQLYAEIGKQAFEEDNARYGETGERLRLVRGDIALAQCRLQDAQKEKDARSSQHTDCLCCPECGAENQYGTNFCCQCGAKLELSQKCFCTGCGAELSAGMSFCSGCGAKVE